MRVSSSHILSFFCFIFLVISSAKSQSEWNLHRIKTEIMKMNEKFKFLSDQIDDFKENLNNNSCLNQDQLTNQVNRWRQDLQSQITNLTRQLSEIQQNQELEQLKKELKETRVKIEQEISSSKSQILKFEQLLESEKSSTKKELNALRVKLEQEVSDRKTHDQTCKKQGEETLKKEIVRVEEELSVMKKKDVSLETLISLTKPHVYLRLSNDYCYEKEEDDFTWTINDVRSKVKQWNYETLSEVFPLKAHSFRAQAKLLFYQNHYLIITLAFKYTSGYGAAVNLKPLPAVYYSYKNQSTSEITCSEAHYLFNYTLPYYDFNYSGWLTPLKYLTEDTISINIHVEPSRVTRRGYSYDGSITWVINGFRSKREMERKGLVEYQLSPSFYTSPKGYRVLTKMRLNGLVTNEGKGLTVTVDFLTGPYDADLGGSFKHRTTVTFLHPTDPTKHLVKSVVKDIKDDKVYWMDMGTHAEIDTLLENDTLYYQIKIVPA